MTLTKSVIDPDLGGMLCAILAQLALLLAGIPSQGLMEDMVI